MAADIDGLTAARAAQRTHQEDIARALVAQMLQGTDATGGIMDWSYVVPASDDITTWKGATRWWGIEQRYRMVCARLAALEKGSGPYWCPTCEEDPGDGWRAGLCLECEWRLDGCTAALIRATEYGRPQPCPRCGERLILGKVSMDHMAAHAAERLAVAS